MVAEILRVPNIEKVDRSIIIRKTDLKQIRADYGAIERVKKPFTDTDLLSVIEKYV